MFRSLFIAPLFCFALLQCTGEDVGRRVSPGYDDYLRNRTIDQKNRDDQAREKIQADYRARETSDESTKTFNAKADSIARAKRESNRDSSNATRN